MATSATLGGGIQDALEVSRYAEELFGNISILTMLFRRFVKSDLFRY